MTQARPPKLIGICRGGRANCNRRLAAGFVGRIAPLATPGSAEPAPPRAWSESPRALTARHVGVAPFPVKNRPETGTPSRQSFPAAAGWCFARPSHKCWVAALSCPGRSAAPQGSVRLSSRAMVVRCRPGTATVCGGHSLQWSRISDAPLRCARAARRPGHAMASDAFGALFTFQTAHLVPAAHFCVRGLHRCFTRPRIEGWAERRETFGCSGTRAACHDAARQALARRLASHSASRRA
jgi:hypothetical protein